MHAEDLEHVPRASIGLPFSDQNLKQFETAIRSILGQTERDWELILVADGATDACLALAQSLSDRRIRLIVHDERLGLAVRLNQIAELAAAPVLFRMDADDVMAPNRLEVQLAAFQQHPHVDVIGSRALLIDENDSVRGLFAEEGLPDKSSGYLRSNAFTHPTVAARTPWFRSNQYDSGLLRSQDKALWLTAHGHSRFLKLDEPVFYYRVDSRLSAKRQAHSSRYDRVLLRRYGPSVSGWPSSLAACAKSMLKQFLYAGILRSGGEEKLYRRKYVEVPADRLAAAQATLDAVKLMELPTSSVSVSGTERAE
ncbi:glycosyltransferase family 2 protein [Microterricola pindariensis]|uniref:Glycosyltransferase 2-like domain-containing protein n=1 Tax=Microterricola pindariensis TaxID=478010 RepID=A0ABX5ASV8_9MICO|nr:glycosyltransferase [Microterricola pindariensis]PPL15759.1 hypothetical protein GY24_13750 [Microterricola pindariensis]